MGFPKYDHYKDSGVNWLGEIPEHWTISSIRAVTKLKSIKNKPELQILSVYREFGVVQKDSREDNHNATSLDTSTYKVVEVNDLVVNKMKAWQGSMGVSKYSGLVSPAYITCKLKTEFIHPNFLHYLLRSKIYIATYASLSYGVRIGQWDMHYEDFKKIPIVYPSIAEQKRIAEFLDRKCSEIDAAIAKKQRLIELLDEQKTILINQAVTKGLDPDVPMKDSGIDWLGEIPAHWAYTKIKFSIKSLDQGWSPQCFSYPASEGKWGVLKVGCVNGYHFTPEENKTLPPNLDPSLDLEIREGDILISRANTLDLVGSAACVKKIRRKLILCDKLYRVRAKELEILPDFLILLMQSKKSRCQIECGASGASNSMQNISQSVILDLYIPKVSLKEQKEIVEFMLTFSGKQAKAKKSIRQEINALQELKQTLIAEAVNGKIKI